MLRLDIAFIWTHDGGMQQATTLPERIAAEVRSEMAWQRRSVPELATVLGVGLRAAQRRYSGEVEIGLDEIDPIADWLGVSRNQLLTGHRDREAVAS